MFKRALVFTAAFLMLFSSCSKSPATKEEISSAYAKGFSFSANCDFYGEKLIADVSVSPEETEILFSSPEVIKGLSAVCGSSGIVFIYEGMEASMDAEKLLKKSPVKELCSLTDIFSAPEGFEISENEKDIIINSDGVCAVLDGKTLMLRSVAFEHSGDFFGIEDFTFAK